MKQNKNKKNYSDLSRFLEDEEAIQEIANLLKASEFNVQMVEINTNDVMEAIRNASKDCCCIIWNLTDGGNMFKGSNIPALACLYEIPYIGSNSYAQMLAQNKQHMKTIVHSFGIETARGINVQSSDDNDLKLNFDPPYFIKPTCFDNSIGDCLTYPICHTEEDVKKALNKLFLSGFEEVIIEEYLPGNEYSVVLLNDGNWVATCVKIAYPSTDYWSSKSKDTREYTISNASILIADQLIEKSIMIANKLQIHDYFRVDYRCDSQGKAKFLEINTTPFLMCLSYKHLAKLHFETMRIMLKRMIINSFMRQK